ncbi:hypothetical protein Bca52824_074001 [Brassica carinata]|uniref:Uncharacterized protein n=1 Tax=Brassica carinata TaxID=52824 RepID=A0A8X7QCP5_BRACI|nr:hypothetical protein Bca52824_074001 [Brassica carinata]
MQRLKQQCGKKFRFNLQEEWQKAVIFKQLGNLWRAGKSRLVSQVRAAKTACGTLGIRAKLPKLSR